MTIEEMERLYAEASPPPWSVSTLDQNFVVSGNKYTCVEGKPVALEGDGSTNAALVAAMHSAFPALLAVVKAAKARSDFYRNEAEHLTEDELLAEEIEHDIALEEALLPFAERQG